MSEQTSNHKATRWHPSALRNLAQAMENYKYPDLCPHERFDQAAQALRDFAASMNCRQCKGRGSYAVSTDWDVRCDRCDGTGLETVAALVQAREALVKAEAVYETNDIHPLSLEQVRAAIAAIDAVMELTK